MGLSKFINQQPLMRSARERINGYKFMGRIIRPFFYALALLLVNTGHATAIERIFLSFDNFSYSSASSIHSVSGEWNDPVQAGDNAFSLTRYSLLGLASGPMSLQLFKRYDAYYAFDNQTAQFLYDIENKTELGAGDEYPLYIRPKKSSALGVRAGYRYSPVANWAVDVFFSLLQAEGLLYGKLEGTAQAIAANDYDFEFSSDLSYDDDPLYGRDSENIDGDGYAIDVSLSYTINDAWRLELEVNDLAGRLRIDNAPYTTATASSDIKNFDEDGYVIYEPAIRGFDGYRDVVFDYDPHSQLALIHRFQPAWLINLQFHSYRDLDYAQLSLTNDNGNREVNWHLLPDLNAVGVGYRSKNFYFTLMSDRLDDEKRKLLDLQLGFQWLF